jgi:uncharacterized protein (TIGR02302 family)
MVLRGSRAVLPPRTGFPGRRQLILAQAIVGLENFARVFARPVLLIGFFFAFAWLGLFAALYPWAHLIALVLFATVFFDALGRARAHYRPASLSTAKRRVEWTSGLTHRPLDVLNDRPAIAGDEQHDLWQTHVERARMQLKNPRWPCWRLTFADRDPYALRYALLILLAVGAVGSWGAWGGRLLAAVNPALGTSSVFFKPALDAWITPPQYTGLPPIMIATPAGAQNNRDVIVVPEGSTMTAHLAEKSGDAPKLLVNDQIQNFVTDDHRDFGATATLVSGDTISIHRGWQELGHWHIRIVPDQPPKVALIEPPSVSERRSVRLVWQANDDYGVTSVTATITPRESLPGAGNQPIEIQLASPDAKDVKRVSFEDLTASPWAGLAVQIQLSAINAAGHRAQSEPADFVLPERVFFHPLARALIDERKKLLQNPSDEGVRNEAANVMAAIAAHHAADYRDDPVVMMALRAGAVRLVLDRAGEAIPSVTDILWQTAVRIEDGATGVAEQNLRTTQKELADALDRGADQGEVQKLIDRLHEALAQYIAQLAAHTGPSPMNDELQQALGTRPDMLTPQDLDHMLEQMRDLSAAGSRDAARAELAKLQQLLENMHTGQPQLTDAQQKMLQRIAALRDLGRRQQQLLDETFRQAGANTGTPSDARKLALQQEDLRHALRSLIDGGSDDATDDLNQGDQAMKDANADLERNVPRGAVQHQNEALAAIRQAMQSMTDGLRASMFMLPGPGMEEFGDGHDPFGRSGFGNFARDDGGIKVPDHMEMRRVREILDELQRRAGDSDRSKTERDYIDRLLRNF